MSAPAPRSLSINYIPLPSIKTAKRNPKAHAHEHLGKSIGRFGLVDVAAILDERTGRIVAGHGRIQALRVKAEKAEQPPEGVLVDESGVWLVPVLSGWASRSDTEADAFLVAHNRITEAGGWDVPALGVLLQELARDDALEGIGFDEDALAKILAEAAAPLPEVKEERELGDEEATVEVKEEDVWVKPGDLFDLGGSRIICGDCRNSDDVKRLMDGNRIAVCVTSPPYASQREYDEASGFKPIHPDKFSEWYAAVSKNVEAHLAPDGSYFINIKEHAEEGEKSLYVKDLLISHVRGWGWKWIDELAWTHSGTPGKPQRRFKNQWEPIFHLARTVDIKFRPQAVMHETDAVDHESEYKATGSNAKAQGKKGSGQRIAQAAAVSAAMNGGKAYPGNVLNVGKNMESVNHSAAFPVRLPEFFVQAYSDEGDCIFDPFMGSGTTLIAATKHKRRAFGTELSPRYTQAILARWERYTGQKARKL